MKRKGIAIALVLVCIGLVIYASRGPNVSNALKRAILPELELATGKKFIAQSIYVNLFPLFIEAKGVKAFDDDGEKILSAERVKGYVGLSGIFTRKIAISKLVIRTPEVHLTREQAEEIIGNVADYLAQERETPIKATVHAIEVDNASLFLQDDTTKASLEELYALVTLSSTSKFSLLTRKARISHAGMPELQGRFDANFSVKGSTIDIKKLTVASEDSTAKGSGGIEYVTHEGTLKTESRLFLSSIKEIFGLKKRGEGEVRIRGSLTAHDMREGLNGLSADLKLQGDLHLETLMELLKVKEPVKGYVTFEGTLAGTINNLQAKGKAQLRPGDLFGVKVDSLTCDLSYKDHVLHFTQGDAKLYRGKATAEASLVLPVVTAYTVQVNAKDVDSKGVFELIGWDPGIPPGKVTGTLSSSGATFSPRGSFTYTASTSGKNILDRVHSLKGAYSYSGDIVHLDTLSVSSSKSGISAAGEVDIARRTVAFRGNGSSSDISDLLTPYFDAFTGSGTFSFGMSGSLDDPLIDLTFSLNNSLLALSRLGLPNLFNPRILPVEKVSGSFLYRKNLLSIRELYARLLNEDYSASGSLAFGEAKSLFEFKNPFFDLGVSAKNLSLERASELLKGVPPLGGTLAAEVKLQGGLGNLIVSGNFRSDSMVVKKSLPLYAAGSFSYKGKEFSLHDMQLKRGKSSAHISGTISSGTRFSFNAEGTRIEASDLVPPGDSRLKHIKTLFISKARATGSGTFDAPLLEASGDISGEFSKGLSLGKGHFKATLHNKDFAAGITLLDNKLSIKGQAHMAGSIPWSAKAAFLPSRYDFILTSLLKEVPEDMLFNMKGEIIASGDKNTITASTVIDQAYLHMYGIGFTSSAPLRAQFSNGELTLSSFAMKSDATEFKVSGSTQIGKSFDLMFEGSSSLAPLKAFSKTIEVVRGNATFSFLIGGSWEKPKINGGLEVANGTLGLKNISYRLTSLTSSIHVNDDRITIERATGKVAGGDIAITGTAYLDRFKINRFFIESKLKDITASLSKNFWVNMDGTLYYRGTPASQTILGDTVVKRARYSERVDWKSALLTIRKRETFKAEPTQFEKTNLNIKVAGHNITIDNNIARARLTGDILVKGTIGQPVLLGTIESKEGIVYFRNNEFTVLKASIDFPDPNRINPFFNIIANTRVQNYNIRLSLDGQMSQFNLSVSSDPPLQESDVFSLLAVGQIGNQLKGLEGGIGAGEATSFLTGKLQDVIEDRLKTVTGFDRIQLDPYVSKTTGMVTPRVTLSKRLLSDKLYATYSTSVNTGEEQLWKLEYLFGKSMSLIGVRDERGALGADIKFRFEFK